MTTSAYFSIPLFLVLACTAAAGDDVGDDASGSSTSEGGDGESSEGEGEVSEGEVSEGETGEGETSAPDPATCAESMAIVCEDFEVDDDFADWDLHVGGHTLSHGDVEWDATHGRGAGALRSWADFQDELTAWGWIERAVPTTHPDLFVRTYAYVPADSLDEWFVLFALNQRDGYASLGLGLVGDTLSTVGWGETHQGVSDSEPFPTDQWVCLEVQLHYGDSNWFSAWRDGQLIVDATPVMAEQAVFDSVFFGLYGGNNGLGIIEFWLDDLVVDTAPIGCVGG